MENLEGLRRRLVAMVHLQPPVASDSAGTPGLLRRLCSAATRALPATWAGISLVDDGQVGGTVTASDAHARALEDLQFDLGEGPCVTAVQARRPVLEADLGGVGFARWPAYAPAAFERGARGVFAFPLQAGPVCVGALDIYQDRPEPLSAGALSSALVFAEIAMDVLVLGQEASSPGQFEAELGEVLAPRLEIYQAQGMVMVDLGATRSEAMALLRAHAFSVGRPLGDVARDVVAGTLRLRR